MLNTRRGYTIYKERIYYIQGEGILYTRRGYTIYKERIYYIQGEDILCI